MRDYKKQLLLVIISIPVLVISFLISGQLRETWQCRSVKSEKQASQEKSYSLETKAIKEWNSFPRYKDSTFGSEARDPNDGGGGQIFSSFEDYFRSSYSFDLMLENRIAYRIVINHPQCFSPREVAEVQNLLDD